MKLCVFAEGARKGSEHEACVVRLLEDGADNEQVDRLSRLIRGLANLQTTRLTQSVF